MEMGYVPTIFAEHEQVIERLEERISKLEAGSDGKEETPAPSIADETWELRDCTDTEGVYGIYQMPESAQMAVTPYLHVAKYNAALPDLVKAAKDVLNCFAFKGPTWGWSTPVMNNLLEALEKAGEKLWKWKKNIVSWHWLPN